MKSPAPLDCVLCHVPKLLEWTPEMSWYQRGTSIAHGLWPIAEQAERNGFRCRIVNLGLEKKLDPAFSLASYVKESGAQVVGFSLMWHIQIYDAIEAARQVKLDLPDVMVVFGGLTATYFCEELLRSYPWIDAVVRGEGEGPLSQILRELSHGSPALDRIDNLSWRGPDGAVRANPLGYIASPEELASWSFANIQQFENVEEFVKLGYMHFWEQDLPFDRASFCVPATPVTLGRGPCRGSCPWCAGSRVQMTRAMGRTEPFVREPEAFARTVRTFADLGVTRFRVGYDDPRHPEPVVEAMRALRKLDLQAPIDFESFGLPSPDLVRAYRDLPADSRLVISVETASEERRRHLKAFPYSNTELEQCLQLMDEHGVAGELFFAVGLPGETRSDFARMAAYQKDLKGRFRCIKTLLTMAIEMEPGAPWFEFPERHGIRLGRRTLQDFHEAHRIAHPGTGYGTEQLTEEEILKFVNSLFSPIPRVLRESLKQRWQASPSDFSQLRCHGLPKEPSAVSLREPGGRAADRHGGHQ